MRRMCAILMLTCAAGAAQAQEGAQAREGAQEDAESAGGRERAGGVLRLREQSPPDPAEPDLSLIPSSAAFYWDNDGAYTRPFLEIDRYYTNGLKVDFGFEGGLVDHWAKALPPMVWGPALDEDTRAAAGIGVTQLMFTPADLLREDLIEDDRPYAGYLGFNLFLQRADRRVFEQFEIDLGVVGPASFVEEAQKQVHAAVPHNLAPQGWRHQIRSEAIVNINYRRRWRFDLLDEDSPVGVQVLPAGGFDLGNMEVSARADLLARFGWNLPDDFGPLRLLDLRDATARYSLEPGAWGFYIFGRVGARAIARDIFLDGNTLAESHSVERERFVGEAQAGMVGRWRWIEAGYSWTWVTEQFERQDKPHGYGSWTVRARWEY